MAANDIKQKLAQHGIAPNKALGQNFLADERCADAIARAACADAFSVLEIGPGLGALTKQLLTYAPRVAAVEIDKAMADVLNADFAGDSRLHIIHADFLKTDLNELACTLGEPFSVAANLPYYATTPICMRLLQSGLNISSMTLMMQKEASARFFASPRSKNYTPLTILSKLYYDTETLFSLAPHAYYPQPEVDSAVLHMRAKPGVKRDPGLAQLLNAAFAMRRKTLINNLRACGMRPDEAEALLARAGIAAAARAEELEPEAFAALFTAKLKL